MTKKTKALRLIAYIVLALTTIGSTFNGNLSSLIPMLIILGLFTALILLKNRILDVITAALSAILSIYFMLAVSMYLPKVHETHTPVSFFAAGYTIFGLCLAASVCLFYYQYKLYSDRY